MIVGLADDVDRLLSAIGLQIGWSATTMFVSAFHDLLGGHTPSCTGTEKKSQPVSFAISAPPSISEMYTNVGSTMSLSPLTARMSFSANLSVLASIKTGDPILRTGNQHRPSTALRSRHHPWP